MSFLLKQGLFKFDIIDRHAILGVSLDADIKKVRQSYLRIVQKIHPDTCKVPTKEDKDFANQLLSKLVNPAYEAISKDYGWNEHHLILGQVSKTLAKQKDALQLNYPPAQQLLQTPLSNLDLNYRQLIQPLTLEQYQNFAQTLDKIAQISELNLVYLMLKENWPSGVKKAAPTIAPQNATISNVNPAKTEPEKLETPSAAVESITAASYIRRAQEYMEKNNFAQAILELRDGIKLEPNNATCHALLGLAYLKQNQVTMAKVHVNKAWQTDPQNALAKQAKQALERQGITVTSSAGKPSDSKTATKTPEKETKAAGIFGGLFGGKKK
jgi:tetratricopeptide (TPR) repeat protein